VNKAGAQKRSKSGNRSFTLSVYSICFTTSFHGKRIINVYICATIDIKCNVFSVYNNFLQLDYQATVFRIKTVQRTFSAALKRSAIAILRLIS